MARAVQQAEQELMVVAWNTQPARVAATVQRELATTVPLEPFGQLHPRQHRRKPDVLHQIVQVVLPARLDRIFRPVEISSTDSDRPTRGVVPVIAPSLVEQIPV